MNDFAGVASKEHIIVHRATPPLKPSQQAGPCVWKQFKLNWPTCFLLHHDRSRSDLPNANEVADLHPHQVAASEFAVDRQVEQRPISQAAALIEVKSYLPYLLRFQGTLRADSLPAFQTWRLAVLDSVSGISMIILRWPEWPSEERSWA
jgi:hypothetical protein